MNLMDPTKKTLCMGKEVNDNLDLDECTRMYAQVESTILDVLNDDKCKKDADEIMKFYNAFKSMQYNLPDVLPTEEEMHELGKLETDLETNYEPLYELGVYYGYWASMIRYERNNRESQAYRIMNEEGKSAKKTNRQD